MARSAIGFDAVRSRSIDVKTESTSQQHHSTARHSTAFRKVAPQLVGTGGLNKKSPKTIVTINANSLGSDLPRLQIGAAVTGRQRKQARKGGEGAVCRQTTRGREPMRVPVY